MSLSSGGKLHVHQSRVVPCPPELPAGFFWYGTRRAGPGRPPKWVEGLLDRQLPASAASGECTSCANVVSTVEWAGPSETTQGDDNSIEHGPIVDGLNVMPEPDELTESPDRDLPLQEAVSGTPTEDPSQECRWTKRMGARGPSMASPRGERYDLRRKRSPLNRLMNITSRSSFSKGDDAKS